MYDAVVIGVSAGGMGALKTILPQLPEFFPLPLIIVQHIAENSDSFLVRYLHHLSAITVKEAEDKEILKPGTAYLAPPGYHLLVEDNRTLSLSVDPRVNFSCPSIDVLFESAVEVYRERLIGVVLTGANADGSQGLKKIKNLGGLAIVQNPKTAESFYMPQSAIETVTADYIVDLDQIASLLMQLNPSSRKEIHGTGTHY